MSHQYSYLWYWGWKKKLPHGTSLRLQFERTWLILKLWSNCLHVCSWRWCRFEARDKVNEWWKQEVDNEIRVLRLYRSMALRRRFCVDSNSWTCWESCSSKCRCLACRWSPLGNLWPFERWGLHCEVWLGAAYVVRVVDTYVRRHSQADVNITRIWFGYPFSLRVLIH